MYSMRRYLLWAAAVGAILVASMLRVAVAQPPPESLVVSGTVLDADTQRPVPQAAVHLNPTVAREDEPLARGKVQAATDVEGRFTLKVGEGDYRLHVESPGYWPKPDETVQVRAGKPLELRLLLRAAKLPARLAVGEVQRVDFGHADLSFRPLFPDLAKDRAKIEKLLGLYNQAMAQLGPVEVLNPPGTTWFLDRLCLGLAEERSVTIAFYKDAFFYTDSSQRSRKVTDAGTSKKLKEFAQTSFVSPEGLQVEPASPHLGQEVTVRSDEARGTEVHLFLLPSISPRNDPPTIMGNGAPLKFPAQDALLLGSAPVRHDCFTFTFNLASQMGQLPDGSPGTVGPGAWSLVLVSRHMRSGTYLLVRPPGPPPARAVVYDQGRVLTWSAEKGLSTGTLASPEDQPLLIGEGKWGPPVTHVSLNFLNDWLEVPVEVVEEGCYRLGPPGLDLTVRVGEEYARVSGTMVQLQGALRVTRGRPCLPWIQLGSFFDYWVQWLGPERVAFLRNLDRLPAPLRSALGARQPATGRGRTVTVTLDGKELAPVSQRATVDPARGAVMVPLRETVETLGGTVRKYEACSRSACGRSLSECHCDPKTAGGVNWEASLGDKRWLVYFPSPAGPSPLVSLRVLALALDYRLTWNAAEARAELAPEEKSPGGEGEAGIIDTKPAPAELAPGG